DGYQMAAALGHRIVPLRPALVPLVVREEGLAKAMQGVSLKNVRVTAYRGTPEDFPIAATPTRDYGRGIEGRAPRPIVESRFGEAMITHFGLGGPVVLLMSLAVVDALTEGPVGIAIDLKPALSVELLRRRIQRDMDHHGRRQFKTILAGLLPAKMTEPIADLCHIDPGRLACQVGATERERLVCLLKSLRFSVKSSLPMATAMVTAGGVSLAEVDPRTMASRLVDGLYFCGEVLDIDAETGGYNLQAAFSTGWVAGDAAAGAGD
ncbi:MAG: aminoacetone oxidase family FAD-binding enzyme, partial [Syntrophales bacterium]|nr:aminoacetone oxidase family FAD-binding enzyme [Syntrophales bacterium]